MVQSTQETKNRKQGFVGKIIKEEFIYSAEQKG
jgi:hypothetical protein